MFDETHRPHQQLHRIQVVVRYYKVHNGLWHVVIECDGKPGEPRELSSRPAAEKLAHEMAGRISATVIEGVE